MVGCWAALGLGPFWDLSHQLPSGHTLASGDPPPRDERPRRLPPRKRWLHKLPPRTPRTQSAPWPRTAAWTSRAGVPARGPTSPSRTSSTCQGSTRSRGASAGAAGLGHPRVLGALSTGEAGAQRTGLAVTAQDSTAQAASGSGSARSAAALRAGGSSAGFLEVSATFPVDTALSCPASISTKPVTLTADLHAPQQTRPGPSEDGHHSS